MTGSAPHSQGVEEVAGGRQGGRDGGWRGVQEGEDWGRRGLGGGRVFVLCVTIIRFLHKPQNVDPVSEDSIKNVSLQWQKSAQPSLAVTMCWHILCSLRATRTPPGKHPNHVLPAPGLFFFSANET